MNAMHVPAAGHEGSARSFSTPQLMLALGGLLAWLGGFAVAEYAHDLMLAAHTAGSEPSQATHLVYEVSAGYVLGVVTALALGFLGRLLQGHDGDLFMNLPWLRSLGIAGLGVVVVACVAGVASHNADGLTVAYDLAFAGGLVVVFAGVLPLYRELEARLRR
jgi:hypothetical protein